MIEQVKSILKMRCIKIFFLLLIILNLASVISVRNKNTDYKNNLNSDIQETIALKTKFKSLQKVYKSDPDDWENFFRYLNWKISILKKSAKNSSLKGFTQNEYYKYLLMISSIDIDCYANENIGDKYFTDIKPANWNYDFKVNFDPTRLNIVYSKSNTTEFIHECYTNEVTKMNLMYQRIKYHSFIDNNSILGVLLENLKADSIISFLIPILIILCTSNILKIYQQNHLNQLFLPIYQSKNKYMCKLLLSIFLVIILVLFLSFSVICILLIKNIQYTRLDTKILIDQVNIFKMTSYSHSPEKFYYMGNEYFASLATSFTIPECLKLIEVWKVLLFTCALDIEKIVFYILLTTFIYFVFYRHDRLKTFFIILIILIYGISQLLLLLPNMNPLAIISSLSLVCGGYGVTWLYGVGLFLLYILFLSLFIKYVLRKVDLG